MNASTIVIEIGHWKAGEINKRSDLITTVAARSAAAAAGVALGTVILGALPAAQADAVAYLVNVTVRPGYNFASADAALSYGYGVCEQVRGGVPYDRLLTDVGVDFTTTDPYQASYLVTQAVGELCPELIGQLRGSAAGYRP